MTIQRSIIKSMREKANLPIRSFVHEKQIEVLPISLDQKVNLLIDAIPEAHDEFAKLRGVPDSPEALKGIPVGAPPAAAAHAASMRAGSAGAADESARARAQSSGAAMERLDRLMRIQNEMASELKSLAASVSAMGDAGGTPPRPPVTPKFSLFSA